MNLKPSYKITEFDTQKEYSRYMYQLILSDKLHNVTLKGNKNDYIIKDFVYMSIYNNVSQNLREEYNNLKQYIVLERITKTPKKKSK